MTICKKCGKIFFNKVDICDVCGSVDFNSSNEVSLLDYECQNCKSMYKNKIDICPNCGSKKISEVGSDRKIISSPGKYDRSYNVDFKRFNKINYLVTVLNTFCDVFRALFGVFLMIMGLVLLRFNDNTFIAILALIAFFFCLFTGLASFLMGKYDGFVYFRLLYYIAIVVFSYFDKDPACFYVCIGCALLYIIITLIKRWGIPKIEKTNESELKIEKEKNVALFRNGVLFSNCDYELVPALKKQYYIRVVINNPSGIVVAFQSKQKYSKIDFEKVNLLLDLNDYNNYYIYPQVSNRGNL